MNLLFRILHTIAFKISLALAIILGIGGYWFIDIQQEDIHRYYREATEEPLLDFVTLLASQLERQVVTKDQLRDVFVHAQGKQLDFKVYDLVKTHVDLRVTITDQHGKLSFDSRGEHPEGTDFSGWRDVSLALKGEIGTRTSRDDPRFPNESILYVTAPLFGSHSNGNHSEIYGTVTVAKPTHNSNLFISRSKRSAFKLSLLIFLSISLVAVLIVFLITKPIRALTAYAKAVSADPLGFSVAANEKSPTELIAPPILPKGEIAELGHALIAMQQTLEGQNFKEQYVRTITHEMKSPLTGIKSAGEILMSLAEAKTDERLEYSKDQEKFAKIVLFEAERLNRLLSDLSLQANLKLSAPQFVEQVNIRELLTDLCHQSSAACDIRSILLKIDISDSPQITGSYTWLIRALTNVINNAIEFTPAGTTIIISSKVINPQQVEICVEDCGPGIPEWALSKVTNQFFSLPRPDTQQRSSGLGLTITQQIVAQHNGELKFENLPGGAGLKVTIVLPIKPKGK
jgi:two-component system sensor histidine kinase CreC